MLRGTKRVTYKSLNPSTRIAEFLEHLNRGRYSKRLSVVLDYINEINTNLDEWYTEKSFNSEGELVGAKYYTERLSELRDKIEEAISRVKLVPSLRRIIRWTTGYRYVGPESRRNDSVLVRHLLDAAATGLLDRVQKCHCGVWFHRRTQGQKFHSAKCREKAFKSTEQWKAYRRKKAKERYWAEKTRAQRLVEISRRAEKKRGGR